MKQKIFMFEYVKIKTKHRVFNQAQNFKTSFGNVTFRLKFKFMAGTSRSSERTLHDSRKYWIQSPEHDFQNLHHHLRDSHRVMIGMDGSCSIEVPGPEPVVLKK